MHEFEANLLGQVRSAAKTRSVAKEAETCATAKPAKALNLNNNKRLGIDLVLGAMVTKDRLDGVHRRKKIPPWRWIPSKYELHRF